MRFQKTIGTLLLTGAIAFAQTPLAQASAGSHHPVSTEQAAVNAAVSEVAKMPNETDGTLRKREFKEPVKPTAVKQATATKKRVVHHTSSSAHKLSGRSGTSFSYSNHAPASGVVGTAEQYLGVPYVFGGSSPRGFDCSGFVQYVYRQNGRYLPRTAADMYGASSPVSNPQPGDLVFFNTDGGVSHVGIYIGGGRFINAAGSDVRIDSLSEGYWANRYLGTRRP